jgi:hypothetical protein
VKITTTKTTTTTNYSIQFFIICVPSQQLQDQLQAEHSAVTGIYMMDKHNIKSRVNCRNKTMQGKTNKPR